MVNDMSELERREECLRCTSFEVRCVEASLVVLKEDIAAFRNEVAALAAWNEFLTKGQR